MNNTHKTTLGAGSSFLILALAACATCAPPPPAGPEQVFSTPEQAVNTFVIATANGNKPALLQILGPQGEGLISSGDPVADQHWQDKFLAAYSAGHELESAEGGKKILVIGKEEWPMPIPLRQVESGWQFDTEAGAQEILDRRVGRNELNVIEICRAYVEAQREYASGHHFHAKPEYAQKFVSSAGAHDGLYWPAKAGEQESPLGPLIADARAEGYADAGKHHAHVPYHGYYYKIVKQQGPDASGGAQSYVRGGHMTGGFALLAFPAKYGDSGVMTFIVNQNGIVHEKNLGPDTAKIAARITTYNPDASWNMP